MNAADARILILSHLDAMLADPQVRVNLQRDYVNKPKPTHDCYALGALIIHVQTATFELTLKELNTMTIKARITFTRRGFSQIVTGYEVQDITLGDVSQIPALEAILTRLTGLEVKIETEAA